MRAVPRERFVPPELRAQAYEDGPLPIGSGQTISQPYIVAYMTEALDVEPSHKVLEMGTGSGYQAAVLSELVREVYTIEIVPDLARRAEAVLRDLEQDQRSRAGRRWLCRLAGAGPLRPCHRDGGAARISRVLSSTSSRPVAVWSSRRLTRRAAVDDHRREDQRRRDRTADHSGPVRPVYAKPGPLTFPGSPRIRGMHRIAHSALVLLRWLC